MPCELFENYTKMCVNKFDKILVFWPLSICENEEDYKNCPLYKVIKDEKPVCIRMEECAKSVVDFGIDVGEIVKNFSKNEKIWKKYWTDMNDYCLTENYINCKRYKILEKDGTVSNETNPDGSRFNCAEFFFGKNKKEVISERI